jgi:hypothetical protein
MSLPRQNSQLVDDDGRPTREFYTWMRGLMVDTATGEVSYNLNALTDVSISAPTTGDTLVYDNDVGRWMNAQAGITSATATLSGTVTLTTTGTWYDGPSVTLSAGTWLITAHASFSRTTATATTWEARVYDGTTQLASGNATTTALANSATGISMQAVVVVTGTPTVKLQATTNAGAAACLMRDTTFVNGMAGATIISAVKIG